MGVMIERKKRLMMAQIAENPNVYIWGLAMLTLTASTADNCVNNGYNDNRLSCYGVGKQAGEYLSVSLSTGQDIPVIKMPSGTKSITVKFANTNRVYNNAYSNAVYWMKDVYCGASSKPTSALYITTESYNGRTESEKTLYVLENADSFLYRFRIYPAISEGETAESIATDVGLSITFNQQ